MGSKSSKEEKKAVDSKAEVQGSAQSGGAASSSKSGTDGGASATLAPTPGPAPGPAPAPAPVAPHACLPLFITYAGENQTEINIDGVVKLCSDLSLEVDDIKVLILAWKCGAAEMGVFKQAEFLTGMTALGLDRNSPTVADVRTKLDQAALTLNSQGGAKDYKALYTYSYYFSREKGQKSLSIELAIMMLAVVLGPSAPHVDQFSRFLRNQTTFKVVSKDEWAEFYDFSKSTNEDCSDFDEAGAWPTMIDAYVGWVKGGCVTATTSEM